MFAFKGKKVLVMGLGLHGGGLESARWFACQGARVTVTDLRNRNVLLPSIKRLEKYPIRYVLGKHRKSDFKKADLIIKNPGVPKNSEFLATARGAGVPIETDISIFLQYCSSPIIAVTGTKGKSTTSSLIFYILKKAGINAFLAGNIQISPLTILSKANRSTPVVLELSSWQLEDISHLKWGPDIAVITNIMRDHMNRYRTLTSYVKSKKLITQHQTNKQFIIANDTNKLSKQIAVSSSARVAWVSTRAISRGMACFIRHGWIYFSSHGKSNPVISLKDIGMPGMHNAENVMAGIAVAKILHVPQLIIQSAVKGFNGIPHRLELVRVLHGRRYYNDSAATIPDATCAALRTIKNGIVLIAGGADKKLHYLAMAKEIKSKVKFTVLLPGTASEKIKSAFNSVRYTKYVVVASLAEALMLARSESAFEDSIVLSPGAASFGLFLNEFDRGNRFKKAVHNLH